MNQQDLNGNGISVEYFEYINASLRTIATFVNTTFIQHDKVTSTIVYTAISLGSSHICKTDLRSNYLQLHYEQKLGKKVDYILYVVWWIQYSGLEDCTTTTWCRFIKYYQGSQHCYLKWCTFVILTNRHITIKMKIILLPYMHMENWVDLCIQKLRKFTIE